MFIYSKAEHANGIPQMTAAHIIILIFILSLRSLSDVLNKSFVLQKQFVKDKKRINDTLYFHTVGGRFDHDSDHVSLQ